MKDICPAKNGLCPSKNRFYRTTMMVFACGWVALGIKFLGNF